MTPPAITYARLRATDPERWRETAAAWRRFAGMAEQWAGELQRIARRIAIAWTGAAAHAAAARVERLHRGLQSIRVLCWAAEEALTDFAAALRKACELLAGGRAAAARAGFTVDDAGRVVVPPGPVSPSSPLWSEFDRAGIEQAARHAQEEITAAIEVAAEADAITSRRLAELRVDAAPAPPRGPLPSPAATRSQVAAWWAGLTPAQRRWLVVTEPAWLGDREGVPVPYRELADEMRRGGERDARVTRR
jgi:hypothetical protein